ncbi:MAG TPA: alpha-2-macroglobulin family protein, partial [Patescibacteria group bacterium]|nr:alpha-2-macroglobulin family protein [Patescibacteria group bacterium]
MGKIKLENFPTGWNYLKSYVGDVEIDSSSITISEYIKPELKIETFSSKKAIFANDKVDFTAKVTFFDGTSASNIPINIYENSSNSDNNKEQSANREGQINYSYAPTYNSSNYYPRYEGVTFSSKTSNQGLNDEIVNVLVYGSKLLIESEGKQENEKARVDATVYNLDLDLINSKGLSDPKSGIASNQKVLVETTKSWSERKESGTYYDFVEKITKPQYTYTNHQEKIESKELTTNNEGKVNYELKLEKEKSYHVKLIVTDKDGHQNSTSQYFYYYVGFQNNEASKAEITMDRTNNSFSLGEEVSLKINKDNSIYKDTETNKFLYILANRGRQEVYLRETPEFNFTFEEKYIPNIYVGAIIFNGRNYEEVTSTCKQDWVCGSNYYGYNRYVFNPIDIEYKENDKKLDLKIITDKDKYVPGDKANITIEVTKDNLPVSNSSVQIVLVDEALLAMGRVNKPSLLTDLYKTTGSFVYYNYYTHQRILPEGSGAERGGGGGDRDTFKDTAYFNTGITNSEGRVTFEIDLPDNITNWLTYAQAITHDIKAGQIEGSVIATKNFFVTSHFPSTVLLKDNPYLAVNVFGNSLKENDRIKASITFYQNTSEIEKKEVEVKTFNEGYTPFPKLNLGSYQVVVRGKYSDTEDGLILPLSVISSRLDFELSKTQNMSENDKFKLLDNLNFRNDKPLSLTITDVGKGKYYHTLKSYCYIRSNRIENKLVTIFSGKILKNKFENEDCIKSVKDLNVFQSSDGGIKQVDWGASDLETTFWSTYIDPNQFDKEKLISYFEKNENTIFGSWGLTILGKPKINKIISLSNKATTFEDKVLSALALEYIGQGQLAKEKYLDILSEYAYTNKPYLRIQADNTSMDSYLINTAYTLLLSSKIQDEYSEGMDLYLRDYRTEAQDIILEVADIAFINSELNKLPNENTQITIKSPNHNLEKDLSKGMSININLQPNEIDKLNLEINKGKAEASINYYVTPEDFDKLSEDKRIKISRSVKKIKGEGSEFKLGDILAVYLKYDFDSKAPLGCYELTDHVPSGFTVIDSPYNYGLETSHLGYMYESSPNVTKGCASNSDWWKKYTNNTSVYYIKVNSVGKFVHEPSILQSTIDPSIFTKTSEDFVTVHQ